MNGSSSSHVQVPIRHSPLVHLDHNETPFPNTQLILAKETVKLVWDALEKCKDNVNRDLVPVQAQYQQLESDSAPKTQRANSDPG